MRYAESVKNFRVGHTECGQSLIEFLVAVAIMAILLPAMIIGLLATREGKPQERQRLLATALLEQTQESIRSVRESNWITFAVDGTFHPVATASGWIFASGSATLSNGFTQSITISDVYRTASGSGAITTTGGTLDPSTKLVKSVISWTQPYTGSVSATEYFTRYLGTASWVQTSLADFNAGTNSGTVVTNKTGGGGEVILGSGGGTDWCNPSLTQFSYQFSGAGVPTMITATQGNAYVGTGQNSSGDNFGHITLTYPPDSETAPTLTYLGTRNPGYKTVAEAADSNYAYLATTKGLVILHISDLSDTNAPTLWHGAETLFLVGTKAYMTSGSTFYIVDVSNVANPTILGQVGISNTGIKTVVVNNTAYVATVDKTNQLEEIDVTNSGSPSLIRHVSMGNNLAGQSVAVNSTGTRAYVATTYSAGKNDVYIIDTSNGTVINSYSTAGMTPNDIAVATANKIIVVGQSANTYQVIDASNELSLSQCGHLATSYQIYGIATVVESNGNDYSYIMTSDTNQFHVILGGSGGAFASSGIFTSSIFDPGYAVAYNFFSATIAQPVSTTMKMKVAVAPPVSNSCANATFSFVGPDGTTGTYFTPKAASISGIIPFSTSGAYQNPQRCYRYKVIMDSSDPNQTPVLYDVTTNYTP